MTTDLEDFYIAVVINGATYLISLYYPESGQLLNVYNASNSIQIIKCIWKNKLCRIYKCICINLLKTKTETLVKLSFFANIVSFYLAWFSCALVGNPGRIILQLNMFSPGLCSRSLSPGSASIWRRYFLRLCSSQMTIRPRIKSWVCSASITLWLTWWAASLRPVLIGRAELLMAVLPFSAIFLFMSYK